MKVTERGWAGHFICADKCKFRRNTLIEHEDIKIVVSTVGLMETPWKKGDKFYRGAYEEIGLSRYFETMAFHANTNDTRYHDTDISREVRFVSPWAIDIIDADDKANDMHEVVVKEIMDRLLQGEKFKEASHDK